MTKEQIKSSLELIQAAIEKPATIDSPTCILEKMEDCVNLLGLSSEVFAWSERLYNEKLGALILAKEFKTLSATDKKMLFASMASEEILLHTKAERLNKGLVHCIDAMRSMLSFKIGRAHV